MLVYTALHQLFFLANFNENIIIPLPLLIIGSGFPLLYGPILFLYVLSLIRGRSVPFSNFLLHLIPFLLFVISFTFYHYLIQGSEVKVYDGYIHIYGYFPRIMWFFSIFFAISGGIYPLVSLYLLDRHKQTIHRQFSYEKEINLNWLRLLIVLTIISFIVSFFAILFIVDWNWNENPRIAFYIVSILNTIFVFFMGYFGLKQTTIFSPQTIPVVGVGENTEDPRRIGRHAARYRKSGLDTGKSVEIMKRLDGLMLESKPYLNGKLTLNDLAFELEISTNHLSQAINENAQKNFFDYVNGYRVEEVKYRVRNPEYDHITLLGIALDCGFNSKSSFNQIFKNATGQTPSEFKKSLS